MIPVKNVLRPHNSQGLNRYVQKKKKILFALLPSAVLLLGRYY